MHSLSLRSPFAFWIYTYQANLQTWRQSSISLLDKFNTFNSGKMPTWAWPTRPRRSKRRSPVVEAQEPYVVLGGSNVDILLLHKCNSCNFGNDASNAKIWPKGIAVLDKTNTDKFDKLPSNVWSAGNGYTRRGPKRQWSKRRERNLGKAVTFWNFYYLEHHNEKKEVLYYIERE